MENVVYRMVARWADTEISTWKFSHMHIPLSRVCDIGCDHTGEMITLALTERNDRGTVQLKDRSVKIRQLVLTVFKILGL